jgi:hypothetical protein
MSLSSLALCVLLCYASTVFELSTLDAGTSVSEVLEVS